MTECGASGCGVSSSMDESGMSAAATHMSDYLKAHVTKSKHVIDKPYKPAVAAVAKTITKK